MHAVAAIYGTHKHTHIKCAFVYFVKESLFRNFWEFHESTKNDQFNRTCTHTECYAFFNLPHPHYLSLSKKVSNLVCKIFELFKVFIVQTVSFSNLKIEGTMNWNFQKFKKWTTTTERSQRSLSSNLILVTPSLCIQMESLGNFHSIDIHRPMHSECSSSFNRIGSFVMNLWRSFLVTFYASLPLRSFYENTDASFGMKMIPDQLLQRQIKLLFNSKKSLVMKMQIKNVIKNRLF